MVHHVMVAGMMDVTRSVVPVTSAGESKITRQSNFFFGSLLYKV